MWSWDAVVVTPDGGGISQELSLTADCLGISQNSASSITSVIFQADSEGLGLGVGTTDIDGYSLRECSGVGSGEGLCDVGFGLTIVSGNTYYRNINTVDFIGDSVVVSNSYATVTDGGSAEMSYATRVDQIDDTLMYKGEAVPGSLDADSAWRIAKLVFGVDGDVTITWAGGNSDFSYAWTDRLSLTYI